MNLSDVLDAVVDKRMKPIDQISLEQLKNECKSRNLNYKGLKLFTTHISYWLCGE